MTDLLCWRVVMVYIHVDVCVSLFVLATYIIQKFLTLGSSFAATIWKDGGNWSYPEFCMRRPALVSRRVWDWALAWLDNAGPMSLFALPLHAAVIQVCVSHLAINVQSWIRLIFRAHAVSHAESLTKTCNAFRFIISLHFFQSRPFYRSISYTAINGDNGKSKHAFDSSFGSHLLTRGCNWSYLEFCVRRPALLSRRVLD
jgi:hypothetical protein